MSTIDALLDKAKKASGAKNDTELAHALGIKPAAVSNYRRGVSLPNTVVCATLAGLTGEPLARVLGIVGEHRAISREEKAVWRKLAASVGVALVAVLATLPSVAHAATGALHAAHTVSPLLGETVTLGIMRNCVRGVMRAFGWYFDVPPVLSSATIWSPIPQLMEIGREKALFRRTVAGSVYLLHPGR